MTLTHACAHMWHAGVGKTSLVLRHVGNTFTASVSPTIGASFFSFSMWDHTNNFYNASHSLRSPLSRMLRECKIKLQLWDTAGQERWAISFVRNNWAVKTTSFCQWFDFDELACRVCWFCISSFPLCLLFYYFYTFRFRSMAPMYYRRANAAMIVYDVTRESTFEEAKEWVKGQSWESRHEVETEEFFGRSVVVLFAMTAVIPYGQPDTLINSIQPTHIRAHTHTHTLKCTLFPLQNWRAKLTRN